eukprot:TRINITY_DN274_c0_g2_i2.p1 TRINITY_DN274_c0_g2~~TRINITY_DN274_c0_g2_i2.p1  ORF type:complete len:132 (-),score=17.65 TRINITY_DN274_c0_g2_i2:593-988(-)
MSSSLLSVVATVFAAATAAVTVVAAALGRLSMSSVVPRVALLCFLGLVLLVQDEAGVPSFVFACIWHFHPVCSEISLLALFCVVDPVVELLVAVLRYRDPVHLESSLSEALCWLEGLALVFPFELPVCSQE